MTVHHVDNCLGSPCDCTIDCISSSLPADRDQVILAPRNMDKYTPGNTSSAWKHGQVINDNDTALKRGYSNNTAWKHRYSNINVWKYGYSNNTA